MNKQAFLIRHFSHPSPNGTSSNCLSDKRPKWVSVHISSSGGHKNFNVWPRFWPLVSWETYPKYLDIRTLEFSVILERLSFLLECKLILRRVLVLHNLFVFQWRPLHLRPSFEMQTNLVLRIQRRSLVVTPHFFEMTDVHQRSKMDCSFLFLRLPEYVYGLRALGPLKANIRARPRATTFPPALSILATREAKDWHFGRPSTVQSDSMIRCRQIVKKRSIEILLIQELRFCMKMENEEKLFAFDCRKVPFWKARRNPVREEKFPSGWIQCLTYGPMYFKGCCRPRLRSTSADFSLGKARDEHIKETSIDGETIPRRRKDIYAYQWSFQTDLFFVDISLSRWSMTGVVAQKNTGFVSGKEGFSAISDTARIINEKNVSFSDTCKNFECVDQEQRQGDERISSRLFRWHKQAMWKSSSMCGMICQCDVKRHHVTKASAQLRCNIELQPNSTWGRKNWRERLHSWRRRSQEAAMDAASHLKMSKGRESPEETGQFLCRPPLKWIGTQYERKGRPCYAKTSILEAHRHGARSARRSRLQQWRSYSKKWTYWKCN